MIGTIRPEIRRVCGAALLVLAGVLLFLVVCTTPATAQSPSATPDYVGASDPKKCTICHLPPGNPPNAQTLTVGCSAVQAHMRNHPGDCVGRCPCQPTPTQNP